MVFSDIDDIMTVVCLSLAHSFLYALGYEHVIRWHQRTTRWDGDRIICLGDYCSSDDLLPDGVLTSAEQEYIAERTKQIMATDESGIYKDSWDVSFHDIFHQDFATEPFSPYCIEPGYGLFNDKFWELAKDMGLLDLPLTEQTKLSELVVIPIFIKFHWKLDRSQPCAVCNLTTGEYVHADAVFKIAGGDEEGPYPGKCFGFGEIICARICWSPDSSISMAYDGDLHQGVWAGHRFEITTMDRFRPLKTGQVWKDVSEEVLEEMVAIWKSEFGDEWRSCP